jgi:hypothetical protein
VSKTLFAAAAALATLATPAFAHDRSFTRDGVTYNYTVTDQDGSRVLAGKASSGETFRLVVRDGWVSGYAASTRVSFRAPRRAGSNVEVAQR